MKPIRHDPVFKPNMHQHQITLTDQGLRAHHRPHCHFEMGNQGLATEELAPDSQSRRLVSPLTDYETTSLASPRA